MSGHLSCFYCRMPLLIDGTFEMDHAPVPGRHGGEDTVPACGSSTGTRGWRSTPNGRHPTQTKEKRPTPDKRPAASQN